MRVGKKDNREQVRPAGLTTAEATHNHSFSPLQQLRFSSYCCCFFCCQLCCCCCYYCCQNIYSWSELHKKQIGKGTYVRQGKWVHHNVCVCKEQIKRCVCICMLKSVCVRNRDKVYIKQIMWVCIMFSILVSGCIRISIIEVKFNVCIQGPAACDIIID